MGSSQSEIIVRGSGEARTLPDRATIRVAVEGEGPDRDHAYQEAARQAKRVDEVVAEYAEAIGRVVTAALVVHPKTRWRRGESVKTGWRATRTTVVEVSEFTQLGEMIAALVGPGGEVSGPAWQIDPKNAAYGDARALAAEDARRRADVYAAALGLQVTGISWVAEPGLRAAQPSGYGQGLPAPGVAMAGAAGSAGDDVIDVTPDEITVDARIEVGFEFGPAAL